MASRSTMLQRLRGGDHAPPAAARVLLDHPAFLLELAGLVLGGEAADALGGVGEAGVVAVHDHLGHHGRHLALDAALGELVVQGARDHVTDGSLGVSADHVQRGLMHLAGRQLVSAQDEADLRAVAVGDDHVPALHDHIGDVLARLLDRANLRGYVFVLFIEDQSVAAYGDDGGFWGGLSHRVSPWET